MTKELLELGGEKQTQTNLRNEQKAFHRKILNLSKERNLLTEITSHLPNSKNMTTM